MLSREDVLEELELLPVWRLRNPSVVAKVSAIPAVVEGAVQIEPVQIEQVPAVTVDVEPVQEAPAIEPTFRMIVSDDGQWVFVMTPDPAPEVETLLQNMLKAVSVKPKQDVADANRSLLDQKIPQVVVVMGEGEAQQLLGVKERLEQLRGKTHLYQQAPVVITYSPSHLLANWQDKAKAWEDLCLAKLTIANL